MAGRYAPVKLRCPMSVSQWSATPRARAGHPHELRAICPSCGAGLALVMGSAGVTLAPPRPGARPPTHVVLVS